MKSSQRGFEKRTLKFTLHILVIIQDKKKKPSLLYLNAGSLNLAEPQAVKGIKLVLKLPQMDIQ